MHKIFLIIQREYLSRVKKKSFIIMTFVVPLLFIAMYAAIFYMFAKRDDLSDTKNVIVVDENGIFRSKLRNTASLNFNYSKKDIGDERKAFLNSPYDYLLYIPATQQGITLLSQRKPSVSSISEIESQLNAINHVQQLLSAGIDTGILNSNKSQLQVNARQLTEAGEEDASSWLASGIGFVSAFLIYMSLFIYGVQVMRGVIEEKTNRIIEVIISSVKPFQLMLGKIIGVGLVGLTQFLLWIILCLSLAGGGGSLLLKNKSFDKQVKIETANQQGQQIHQTGVDNQGLAILHSLDSVPLFYTLSIFLFYFLFGYLLYSSIFAAVGSAVDSETETQQFMLPITMPLIFTFIISINLVINNPESNLSFWLSVIPFTSPIAMMIRVPFGVPVWELALSMSLLVAGFLVITWVAARIYRVGILMYGKKASYRELLKWFMYKE